MYITVQVIYVHGRCTSRRGMKGQDIMATATKTQAIEIHRHMLNLIEDKGYDVEEAAEAVQPWFPEFSISELVAIYRA